MITLTKLNKEEFVLNCDLIETIRAYFESGGNLKRVSEQLFTHYNTVIYRINRIRDTLNIDLKDPETAFTIQLALKIRDVNG